MKNLFIAITGGLGKQISFTRIAASAHLKYNKIYVCSPYVELFNACPAIDGVYNLSNPAEAADFLKDAMVDSKNELIIEHMYDMPGFIKKELDYFTAWCKILGMELTGTPNLDPFRVFPEQMRQQVALFDTSRPFIIVQFTGGQSPINYNNDSMYSNEFEPLQRHYPTEYAQRFIDLFHKDNPDIQIIHYSLPNEPALNNTSRTLVSYLTYYALAQHPNCIGFIGIDSSLQHLISGIKPGVVIWGHTLPENFGYPCNHNIVQPCRRDDIIYFNMAGPSYAKIDYIKPEELLKEVDDYFNSIQKG